MELARRSFAATIRLPTERLSRCTRSALLATRYCSHTTRMKVTGLALVPPPSAADLPKVTPELLASVLARYSRSNEGLAAILSKVDLANPDASIDRILKFVDYGHASIGGLTGGLAIALDDVSMWLAYKIFETRADGRRPGVEHALHHDGRRPIFRLRRSSGFPEDLAARWQDIMARAFASYHSEYARLDALATDAAGTRARSATMRSRRWSTRLRKNYALDRARYFIPFATRTNLGLVQSSRMWAQTVKHLDSLPQPEARTAAKLIRDELLKQSPRLMRHSSAEKSYEEQAQQELAISVELGLKRLSTAPLRGRSLGSRRSRGAALSAGNAIAHRSASPSFESLRPAWLWPRGACVWLLRGITWRSPSCAISTGTARATDTRR